MSIKSILKICALVIAFTASQSAFAGSYWGLGAGTTTWDIKPLFGAFEVKDGPTLDLLMGVNVRAAFLLTRACIPAMATFHPEFLLRNPELKKPTWLDIQAIQKRLADGKGS